MSYSIVLINTDTDMDQNGNTGYNYFLVDASSNNIDVQMSNSAWDGLTFIYNRTDASSNVVSLSAKTGYTINGNASIILPINKTVEIVYYQGTWFVSVY